MDQIDLNANTYRLLYELENQLREFIVAELSSAIGRRWQKQRVDGNSTKEWKGKKEKEEEDPWIETGNLDLIYYSNFSELKDIIIRKNNWDEVFESHFGSNKKIIETKLEEANPLRNKVAHNRPVSPDEFEKLKLLVRDMRRIIDQTPKVPGSPTFRRLNRSETYEELDEALGKMQGEMRANLNHLRKLEQINLETTESTLNKWWDGNQFSYLDSATTAQTIQRLREYHDIPRAPGCRPALRQFVESNNLSVELEGLLSNIEEERKHL